MQQVELSHDSGRRLLALSRAGLSFNELHSPCLARERLDLTNDLMHSLLLRYRHTCSVLVLDSSRGDDHGL